MRASQRRLRLGWEARVVASLARCAACVGTVVTASDGISISPRSRHDLCLTCHHVGYVNSAGDAQVCPFAHLSVPLASKLSLLSTAVSSLRVPSL